MKDFSKERWGLVLAGGGGKGAYQVGVIKALAENGIDDYITGVSGSSVGALNAVLFAYGDVGMAEEVWKGITPKQFLEISPDMIDFVEGLVPRDGLVTIMDNYLDLEKISRNEKSIYATTTVMNKPRYHSLNYRPGEEIKNILLASSALPAIYEPVIIGGEVHRDGGLSDNMPIAPLYAEGVRHFIVVGLSPESRINEDRFEDAEFVLIKPTRSIGEFLNGTLDFTARGAVYRMQLGYLDAVRALTYSDKDMRDENVRILYEAQAERDYAQMAFEIKKDNVSNAVSQDMNKIDELIKKYS